MGKRVASRFGDEGLGRKKWERERGLAVGEWVQGNLVSCNLCGACCFCHSLGKG